MRSFRLNCGYADLLYPGLNRIERVLIEAKKAWGLWNGGEMPIFDIEM